MCVGVCWGRTGQETGYGSSLVRTSMTLQPSLELYALQKGEVAARFPFQFSGADTALLPQA